jgi:hypothetical protein
MTTGIHWKILIAFVLTPALCFMLFIPIYLNLLKSNSAPDNGVIVPLGIFGTLGLWLALTAVLRAKRVTLTDSTLIIDRIFTFRTFEYETTDIVACHLTGQVNQFDSYDVLQFRTKDNKVHSIVSYELTGFDEIVKWIDKTKAPVEKIGLWNFIATEYAIPFLIAAGVIIGMVFPLTLK